MTDEEKNKPELADEVAVARNKSAQRIAASGDAGAAQDGANSQKAEQNGVIVSITMVSGDMVDEGEESEQIPPREADGDKTAKEKEEDRTIMLNTRRVENALYKRFIKFGLTMVDPNYAREKLTAEADKARRLYQEDELVWLLGREAGFDIIILGHGRINKAASDRELIYTFRTVRVSDGITLAADMWSDDIGRYAGEGDVDRMIEQVADYIAGNLADQMWTHWRPPRRLQVTLYNAKSQRDVVAVMRVFKNQVESVVGADFLQHEAGVEGGIGRFSVRYTASYEELIEQIARNESQLPFDLDKSGTTRDTLTIRLRDTE